MKKYLFKSYQLQAIQQERQQQNINNILSKRYANDPVLFLWRLADRRCEGTTKIKYPITCTRLKMQRRLLVLLLHYGSSEQQLQLKHLTTVISEFKTDVPTRIDGGNGSGSGASAAD